jgi:HPt (histidine-containing phosphotransfer) domain-containing protein
MCENGYVDLTSLEDFRLETDKKGFKKLLHTLFDAMTTRFQQLQQAIIDNDIKQQHHILHLMTSTTGVLGLTAVHKLTKELSEQTRYSHVENISEKCDQIKQKYEKSVILIQQAYPFL